MACCGQSREKARTVEAPVVAPRVNTPAPNVMTAQKRAVPLSSGGSVKLRYTGMTGVRVQGPASGRIYTFSGAAPEALIDRRDVDGLMRSGLFRRAV